MGSVYVLLLEVKDFWGYERENLWRITGEPNHARRLGVPYEEGDLHLEIELAQKVRDTLAGFVGAATKSQNTKAEFAQMLREVCEGKKKLLVLGCISFAEQRIHLGNSGLTLDAQRLKDLQSRLRRRLLPWLKCQVLLINPQVNGAYESRGIAIIRNIPK